MLAIRYAALLYKVLHAELGGARADGEPLGYLGVRTSLAQELQDLHLTRGKGKQSQLRDFALF